MLTQIRQAEQQRMDDYLHSSDCLMRFLARELDDPEAEACGRCAVCVGEPLVRTDFSTETAAAAVAFLRHSDNPIKPRKTWKDDSLLACGWKGKIPDTLQAEEGRSLSVWGDEGWGRLVQRGKKQGRFDPALVPPLLDLIHRWSPDPVPDWVTCVPSLNHPTLVPDIASQLAAALKVPFIQCIQTKNQHQAQKMMHNSYQQARNLAGVFVVDAARVLDGPVLLIDDMVDSGWTFTVVAALLREAGSGPVFPLALTNTSSADDA
jgi:ATP-dependent DNA helicase RecQ